MEKYCECGKVLDERLNYCVHCCKEVERVAPKIEAPVKKAPKRSKKYSPLLEILKG